MSRIELGGFGDPIPLEALVDLSLDDTFPSLVFNLPDGSPFDKTDYAGVGYTHYEAWCIGAAGGRAGRLRHRDALVSAITSQGGGGGGGGLHHVSGLLSDLLTLTPVVVGVAGADGADGADTVNEATEQPGNPGSDGGYSAFGSVCEASGGKGGLVTGARYGGTTVPIPGGSYYVWRLQLRPGGDGGEGGIGGQTVPGGGAAGGSHMVHFVPGFTGLQTRGYYDLIAPVLGSWDGESIGEGGGGGRGGTHTILSSHIPPRADPSVSWGAAWPPDVYANHETNLWYATAGAKGSFNFADTSHYGNGQPASLSEPILIDVLTTPGRLIVPGGGGGGRVNEMLRYGSFATGFSPNGCVVIRLFRVA